jgi:hypothetical protein
VASIWSFLGTHVTFVNDWIPLALYTLLLQGWREQAQIGGWSIVPIGASMATHMH